MRRGLQTLMQHLQPQGGVEHEAWEKPQALMWQLQPQGHKAWAGAGEEWGDLGTGAAPRSGGGVHSALCCSLTCCRSTAAWPRLPRSAMR